jgi:LmbE family N-acetylglucosaminyl deacetylase
MGGGSGPRRPNFKWIVSGIVLALVVSGCGEDTQSTNAAEAQSLIVVSPHQDDETIMAGGLLYRAAHEGSTKIDVIYVTAGDAAGRPGPCREESEEEKKRKIMELREEETRAACRVLGIAPSRIHFLRHPDQGLVADSRLSGGRRVDVLSEAGEEAVAHVVDLLPRLVPSNASSLLVITASFWDGHPDHRATYRAARTAAERVRNERGIPVTILHAIVHDDIPLPICCAGDLFWPNNGLHLNHDALIHIPLIRPRPPSWDRVLDAEDAAGFRAEALNRHESQIVGYPELCMTVYLPRYYQAWREKTQEAFWEEIL